MCYNDMLFNWFNLTVNWKLFRNKTAFGLFGQKFSGRGTYNYKANPRSSLDRFSCATGLYMEATG